MNCRILVIIYVNHQAQSALSNGQLKSSENHRKRRSRERDYNEPNISYDDGKQLIKAINV